MSEKTLKIVATITAKENKIPEVLSLLQGLLEPTRAESGCISYDLHQNNDKPKEFVLIEEWKSEEEFGKHFETDHLKEAIPKLPDLLESDLDIRKYTLLV